MCNWNIEIGQIQLAIAKRLKVIDYLELRQVIVDVIEQARSKESDREKVELIRQCSIGRFRLNIKRIFRCIECLIKINLSTLVCLRRFYWHISMDRT